MSFTYLGTTSQSSLGYTSKIDVDSAIKCAYELGTANKITEEANFLRETTTDDCDKTDESPWPHRAEDLSVLGEVVSPHLKTFLSIVITGMG